MAFERDTYPKDEEEEKEEEEEEKEEIEINKKINIK